MQICEFDRFSRPCVIGDLQFAMAERENLFGSGGPQVDVWADMMRNTAPDEGRPQVLVSLSYLPSAERLTVVVLKAKNLAVPANKEHVGKRHIDRSLFIQAARPVHEASFSRSLPNAILLHYKQPRRVFA